MFLKKLISYTDNTIHKLLISKYEVVVVKRAESSRNKFLDPKKCLRLKEFEASLVFL